MERCSSNRPSLFSRMRRLLDRLGLSKRTARPSATHRDRRATLTLEVLEDRLCPAIDYWTGAGTIASHTNPNPNDNWHNSLNWVNAAGQQVLPSAGDILVFGTGAASKVANNDYGPGTVFDAIQISGDGYLIQGNGVKLKADAAANGIGVSNSGGFNTVALDLTLGSAQAFTDDTGSTLDLAGSLNNGGHLLTLQPNGNILYTGQSIGGSGGLTLQGNGFDGKFYLENSTPDTYTGVTTVVDAGILFLDGAQGSAIVGNLVAGDGPGPAQNDVVRLAQGNQVAGTSHVTVYQDGLFDLNGFNDTIGSLTMTGGYVTTGTGTLTLNGNVTTLATDLTAEIEGNLSFGPGGSAKTFTVASGSAGTDLDVSAVVTGGPGAELVKAGAGTMRLSSDNSYSGQTLVSAGTLTAGSTDALGTGSVMVSRGATLEYATGGSSSLVIDGNLNNAGVVDIDGAGTVGTLAIHGNYTQTATGALQMALASTSTFDQVKVSDTAALAGTLDVSAQAGFLPAVGNQFPIMMFGSSSGSFGTVDLPHPDALSLAYGLHGLTIVDTAPVKGSGNPSPSPNIDIWTGEGANDNWSNALNWAGGVAPQAGDALVFAAHPADLSSNNDYAAGTSFASITIAGSGYLITGNDLTLQDSLTATNTAGMNTVDLPLTLSATNTEIGTNPGTTLTIDGVISGPFSSNVSFVGGGTVVLGGDDTFEGYSTVTAGILALNNLNALSGAPINGGRGTSVDSGATLQLWASGVYALNPLQLSGAGVGGTAGALENMAGDNTWQGPIKLDGDATITSEAGSSFSCSAQMANEGYDLTINAVGDVDLGSTLSGAGGVTKTGSGTLTFFNPAPNLYAGATLVSAGTLLLDKAEAIEALSGSGVTVKAGATLAGKGIIAANVINDGVVSPGWAGSPTVPAFTGVLDIQGNYTQDHGAMLDIGLGGTKPSQYDQLEVSQLATLKGELDVTLLNDFQPPAGNNYGILTFGSSSGQFGTFSLPTPSNGVVLSAVFDAQGLTIDATVPSQSAGNNQQDAMVAALVAAQSQAFSASMDPSFLATDLFFSRGGMS